MSAEVQESYDVMTIAYHNVQRIEKRDEFSVYGEHIANQLQGLQDKHTTTVAQFYIDEIFFKAKMGAYSRKSQTSTPSPSTTPLSECSTSKQPPASWSFCDQNAQTFHLTPLTCTASWIDANITRIVFWH